MKMLSVISHKGGSGKTSTAVLLAEELARRGFRVVAVDADRQRSAGLLLGVDTPSGAVQETQNPRLRYYSSAGVPLREVPNRAQEILGLFDVAVVDTPSLDDPLARAWLQQSHAALMVVPIDPLSIKTLDGADNALEELHQLNPDVRFLGMLPTMYDENAPGSRSLLQELVAARPGVVLQHPIPMDPGLTHRAGERYKTEAGERTRAAYAEVANDVVAALDLEQLYPGAEGTAKPKWTPEAQRAAMSQPAIPPAAAAVPPVSTNPAEAAAAVRKIPWVPIGIALLVLVALAIGFAMGQRRSGTAPEAVPAGNVAAVKPASHKAAPPKKAGKPAKAGKTAKSGARAAAKPGKG